MVDMLGSLRTVFFCHLLPSGTVLSFKATPILTERTFTSMKKDLRCLSGTTLKLLAMLFMLLDHMWATGIFGFSWLTAVGRLAFPIFAFQIAEGMARTHDFRKYASRMLLFALISEIPFNFMMGGSAFYPLHQNVLFTFLIAMVLIRGLERIWAKHPGARWKLCSAAGFLLLGYTLGFVTFVDYYGFGVAMVLLFWLTREIRFGWLWQLLGMYLINWVQMGGLSYVLHLFGTEVWIPQQGLAMLALIPIWLYNGEKGPGGRKFRWFGYAFYPLHITVLLILQAVIRYFM